MRFYFLIVIMTSAAGLFAEGAIDITSLYNEATTAYEAGDMATAVYNLELASLLDPFDEEIANNLRIVKTKVAVDVVEIEPFFLTEWISSAASVLSPGGWKYVTVVILLFLIYLVFQKVVKKSDKAIFSVGSISIFGIICILTILLGNHRAVQLHDGKYSVVFGDTEALKEGPDQVSKEIKEISQGVKLEILDASEDWYKVSAMDKEQGWIKKKDVKIIKV